MTKFFWGYELQSIPFAQAVKETAKSMTDKELVRHYKKLCKLDLKVSIFSEMVLLFGEEISRRDLPVSF